MSPPLRPLLAPALCLLSLGIAHGPPGAASADEGMWTFNHFPAATVKARHGFAPDDRWLGRVQRGVARVGNGCSGSFVSPAGLVMTNHHCAQACMHQHSTKGRDLMAQGFFAATARDELRCDDFEVAQLLEISDVTERLKGATAGLSGRRYYDAEKAESARIERSCQTSERLRCDVVRLYQGGVYNLYRYRRFQDVRLVFAPEFAIAFFGGDPDNFRFPRYDLDVTFLRVYEDGAPAQVAEPLRFSPAGPRDGELVFVPGHPGRTERQMTVAQLAHQRDVALPDRLIRLAEARGLLTQFVASGPEAARIAEPELFGVENAFKALTGRREALLDRTFFAAREADEAALRKGAAADPALAQGTEGAWDAIARAQGTRALLGQPYSYLEKDAGGGSTLFHIARTLLRGAAERQRPAEARLREFRESALPALLQELYSPAPIHDEVERLLLTHWLRKLRESLSADHPVVRKVLGPRTPEELATQVLAATGLRDVALRRRLWEGGDKAVAASADPLLRLVRSLDIEARAIRKRFEDEVEAVEKQGGERIARARFALRGQDTYPDATSSLRLSYGVVRGFVEGEQAVPPFTNFGGLYGRATGRPPFQLPERWVRARAQLPASAPLNFCTTNDIIGGNSGSPVIDRAAQIVGLIFDNNLPGLGGAYGHDDRKNRGVAVHSEALLLALDRVYGARRLVDELRPRR